MKFTTAAACESVVWQMRLADYPRALNRSKLNDLYNGFPPYTQAEQRQNKFVTNTNFLEGTKILHDARRQFSTAFTSAPQFFTVDIDYGPRWKRRGWSARVTNTINRIMKQSRRYLDCQDSTHAGLVLHGIAPSMWEDRYAWCPYELGIEDALVPSNTYVSLRNLPFVAFFRQYTGFELWKKTHGPKVDPAWNMPMVERAISWVDQQAATLMSSQWPTIWSPEKLEERMKQDGGLYASDAVQTIDTFDVYFWNDDGKKSGWNRRIILDAWGSPGPGTAGGINYGASPNSGVPDKTYLGTRGEYLYDPGDRVYADTLDQIVHFQFADASCVAPFRYHSVRSLGFLLYSVCHLQNRLRCRFNDSVFENLLQYFRVANPADAERLSKVDLIDKGIIPEGLNFVKQDERWQINEGLISQAMQLNRQTMADNSASFTQDFDFEKEDQQETATRTMAKVNATAALVGAMLNKAYNQQTFQYREIARRFCIKNSRDAEVRKFRVQCLKAGVPEEALQFERWDVQPVRVVGSGNKMLQVAMADKLMAIRGLLDPEGQKLVERIYVLANSDDPALAEQLVPEQPHISDSVHDAQALLGTLLAGLPVSIEDGMNHVEYIETWLHALGLLIQRATQNGGMASMPDIVGMNNLAMHIEQHIGILAQDPSAKQKVRQYQDDLNQLVNEVKAFQQRLTQQMQQQGNGAPGANEAQMEQQKAAAENQATVIEAQNKAKIASESHAQKTAQRQVAFQQQQMQQEQKHAQELAQQQEKAAIELEKERVKAEQQAKKDKEKEKDE